jgi:hypothetical protein
MEITVEMVKIIKETIDNAASIGYLLMPMVVLRPTEMATVGIYRKDVADLTKNYGKIYEFLEKVIKEGK